MGVQGLWELLAPVGRRVSVESLSGRKLAIDASIWIIQFMKAMRDDKGDMIRNAHLLGFFRRICKLLYLRAKPVFVFDGGTPALKRRTVIARRRQRERAQSQIRKTAEKLLLNHLRTRKLDEIAQNIGLGHPAKKKGESNVGLAQLTKKQGTDNIGVEEQEKANGKEEGSSKISEIPDVSVRQPVLLPEEPSTTHDTGKWTAPLVSELDGEPFTSNNGTLNDASDDSGDDSEEYFMLPPTQGRVDPAVLASLPPSMQLNLLVQMREQLVTDNRKKFQKVAKNPASFSQMQIQAYLKTVAFRRDINQVQKAAAGKGIGGIPSARIVSEVDREYIFSTTFQSEREALEADKAETHTASGINQDHLHVFRSKQSQERLTETIDIDESAATSERTNLQNLSPENVPDDNEGLDIEWEDGDDGVDSMASQPVKAEDGDDGVVSRASLPVKGAVITIEIDQNDLLADGVEVQKLGPDTRLEGEDIEWEDGIWAIDCINGSETKDDPMIGGGSMAEHEIGTGFLLTSEGRTVSSPENVDKTLRDIESAELEEAIRQSLQDHPGCKAPKLVIRDESTVEFKHNEVLPPYLAATEAPLSEEAFLARERERKGKAIVDDYQAVCLRNRAIEEDATLALRSTELEQASGASGRDTRYAKSGKSLTSEIDNAPRLTSPVSDETIQAHADDSTTNLVQLRICKPLEGHTSVTCFETFQSSNQTVDAVQSKGERVVKVEASICEGVEAQNELNPNMELSSLCSYPEQVGEEKKSSDGIEAVDITTDAAMEHKIDVPSMLVGSFTAVEEDYLHEALLKEAEEVDLAVEREAFAMRERDLLAQREDLSRQQAELQAEIEAEQAAMQANLQEERDLLFQEEMELRASQRKNERNAESVSGEMFSECQELLQMFGLPYIIAPMEAEAQCAYMDSIGLVDGVVTEDCDVFLFGGRNVFKNIFDDRKYVETYYMKDVESELGLDQEKLIHMALLLGSDYTEGISGIGIVNAIEVVNAFQGEAGLQKFKEWLDAPDYTLLNKVRQDGKKKQMKKKRTERGSEADDNNGAEEANDTSQSAEYNHQQQDFMDKHRAVSKNWNAPESFPNPVVINAYTSPQVDKSTESFSWGRPDLEALRRACLERFGWNKSKSDELLQPVLKEYDRHETQLRLEAFYTFNQRFAKIRSKRIQKAVTHVTGRRLSSELVHFPKGDDSEEPSPSREETKGSKLKKDAFSELEPPTKATLKTTAGLKRRKKGVKEDVQQLGTAGKARGRGRTTSNRGRGRGASKRSDPRFLSEASLSEKSSSEGMVDSDDEERTDGVHVTVPRRSSRLSERAVYNFSGSEDDGDGGLCARFEEGGGPAHAGSVLPLDVKEHGKSSVLSNNAAAEADLNKDGEEIGQGLLGPDVVNHQYGLQDQKDEDYLAMGGGFCVDEGHQESLREPFAVEIEKESLPLENNTNIDAEESTCPEAGRLGSNTLGLSGFNTVESEFSNREAPGHLRGVEPTLHAVPFLRRKKRRVS